VHQQGVALATIGGAETVASGVPRGELRRIELTPPKRGQDPPQKSTAACRFGQGSFVV
jgi:hypothetical protein